MSEAHVIGWTVDFPREAWCVACMPGIDTLQQRLESRGFGASVVTTVHAGDRTTARCWHCDETLVQADIAGQRALEDALRQLQG